jgi:hypothetical protein
MISEEAGEGWRDCLKADIPQIIPGEKRRCGLDERPLSDDPLPANERGPFSGDALVPDSINRVEVRCERLASLHEDANGVTAHLTASRRPA